MNRENTCSRGIVYIVEAYGFIVAGRDKIVGCLVEIQGTDPAILRDE